MHCPGFPAFQTTSVRRSRPTACRTSKGFVASPRHCGDREDGRAPRKILKRERFEVLEAGSGEETLAAASSHQGAIGLLFDRYLTAGSFDLARAATSLCTLQKLERDSWGHNGACRDLTAASFDLEGPRGPPAALEELAQNEWGAKQFLIRLEARAAPFALIIGWK